MQHPDIIVLTGNRRVGKDTAAKYLVAKHSYIHMQFARPMYKALADMLDMPLHELYRHKDMRVAAAGGKTVRELLNTIGTEWGRDMVDPCFWVNLLTNRIMNVWDNTQTAKFVISDCRFDNEWDCIIDVCGKYRMVPRLCEVQRDSVSPPEYEGQSAHRSAQGLTIAPDAVFTNNGTIDELESQLEVWLQSGAPASPYDMVLQRGDAG